ncbi:MAG: type II/IV secretion system protein [Thiotrichaceae bacterium]|nr:type II/IV secretion system protein [Thiotrichaceae bacterium]
MLNMGWYWGEHCRYYGVACCFYCDFNDDAATKSDFYAWGYVNGDVTMGVTGESRRIRLDEISDQLLADGLIDKKQHEMLMLKARFRDTGEQHPFAIVASHELSTITQPPQVLTQDFLSQWLAEKLSMPYRRIDPLKVDVARVAAVVSYSYAERNKLLPIEMGVSHVVIATAEPYQTAWMKELEHILNKEIRLEMTSPADIERFRIEFYAISKSVVGANDDQHMAVSSGINNLEQMLEMGKAGSLDANDQHVVNIVDWLLQYAFDQRASDIHLEPRREQGNIRFRIDGMLHQVYQLPATVMAAVVSRIKILGRMDLAEKRRPLDGRLKTKAPNGKEVELRLSTMPTAFGEKMVMRIFDPDILVKNFSDLGFGRAESAQWGGMIDKPHGIILVTGPTGSGKTTTLYSTLKHLAKPELNICTIEDPIEMVVPDFNQMQVQHNIDLAFADGVRALLRQDPDIIMVGEIRDRETAEVAIQAALTGHLVLSTLHTNDAVLAITRLLEIGVPQYMISASVIGVVAQRLVRTLCPHCKQPAVPDKELWRALSQPWKSALPEKIMAATGCLECRQTGYAGRVGIYEMMTLSSGLRELLHHQKVDIAEVRQLAQKEGMRPLRISGLQKVAKGVTSLDEVFRVAPPPQMDG